MICSVCHIPIDGEGYIYDSQRGLYHSACANAFDVNFPSSWSGWRTAFWCLRRNIGRHIIWVNEVGVFTRITVIDFGRFKSIPIRVSDSVPGQEPDGA